MKTITIRVVMSAAIIIAAGAAKQTWAQAPSKFQFGMNWFDFDAALNLSNAESLYGYQMRCTIYHTGADTATSDLFSSAVASSGGNFMALSGGAIGHYSTSQRMKYMAKPDSDFIPPSDTLIDYYFYGHPNGNPYPPSVEHPTYWEITNTIPPYSDNVVLNNNQIPNAYKDDGTPWRIAVGLQVPLTDTTDTNYIISVYAIHARYIFGYPCTGGVDTTVILRDTQIFNLPWDSVRSVNTDTAFFSQPFWFKNFWDTVTVYNSTTHVRTGYAFTDSGYFRYGDFVNLEVHSTRIADVRLSWVCIEDTIAHSLLAGVDLDPGATALKNLAAEDTIDIQNDSAAISAQWNHHVVGYYLFDEPPYAAGASMGWVNKKINRRGNTEVQWGLFDAPRFGAQVGPAAIWSEGFEVGDYDCMYENIDSSAAGNYIPGVPMANGYFKWGPDYWTDTIRHYYFFPNWVSAHKYSLDTLYNTWFPPMPYDYEIFDPEIRSNNFTGNIGSIGFAQQLNNVATANTAQGGWWTNTFFPGALDKATDSLTAMYPYPEQLQVICNISLSVGCKGFMFYTGPFTGGGWDSATGNYGFTDLDCLDDSDYKSYGPHSLPVFYQRNCLWAIRYHNWLDSTASVLLPLQLRGAYSRHMHNVTIPCTSYGPSVLDTTEQLGQIFIDPTGDHNTRPMLRYWPDSSHINSDSTWMAYRKIYTGDTSITNVSMPDSLTLVVYGCYSKDTTAITTANPGYLTVLNLFNDPRDILSRFWTNDADTGTYVRRSERYITTKLNMASDTAVSKWWRVTDLQDSVNFDSVYAYNGSFTRHYNPAQMRIYRISPAYSVDAADNGETIWNNGRRSDYNGKFFHVALKNTATKHISYTRSDTCTLTADPLAGFMPAQQIDAGMDSSKHPSIRSYPGTISIGSSSGLNLIGVVYEGRKHISGDTDRIYIKLAVNGYNGVDSLGSYSRWNQYVLDSFMVSTQYKYDTNYEMTPVLCPIHPYDSVFSTSAIGYLAAWSEGINGIGMRAITFNAFTTPASPATYGPIVHVDSGITSRNACFPTLTEREMTSMMKNCDTADLAYEIDSGGTSQIYYRAISMKVETSGSDSVTISPYIRELVSDSTGCTNRHPNIDASHIMRNKGWYDYVPRVVWEGTVPLGGRTVTGVARMATYIYSAVRDTSGRWVDYAEFRSKDEQNFHPSARVYETDSATVSICSACVAYTMINPMVVARTGGGSGGGSPTMTVYSLQPANVGWYTNTNRLLTAQAEDGIIPSFPNFTISSFNPWLGMGKAMWSIGNWTDNGMTPTLEVNGRDSAAWAFQRELFLSTNIMYSRIPILSAHFNYDTTVYYGKTLTLQDNTCPNSIGLETHTSAQISPPIGVGKPYLVAFQSQKNPLFPDVYLATDSLTVTPGVDTIRFISQMGPVDTAGTRSWVASEGSKIKATLAVRNALTDSIIQILDTLDYTYSNYLYQADTGFAFLSNPFDSIVFLTVSIDTTGVTNAVTRGFSVTEEYAPVTDSSYGFGKALNSDRIILPSAGNAQAYPNPFYPNVSVAYQVSAQDGGGNVNVSVYDIMGRLITTLQNGVQNAGDYTVPFNAGAMGMPAGVYMVLIRTTNNVQMKQVALVK